jgi:hypothetical protein
MRIERIFYTVCLYYQGLVITLSRESFLSQRTCYTTKSLALAR